MNDIQIFNSQEFGQIRISGTSDNPLFCLADICRVLDIQPSVTKKRLKQDGVNLIKVIDAYGREQLATFVTEQNLYKVIMRSDKPQAEQFQDWICGEILPSIRKHGAYMTPAAIEQALSDPDFIIGLATQLKTEKQRVKQLADENKHKE